ncbi:hypothetical protein BDP27DRAFT_1333564 [Rhodocollybia butyracea]|uniref:Uncharacterized protein n=1 Tax=Rhodocollybia butyracea TaxID=206335 RepID=A0A9P5PJD0_9AGAR|nr:hypothetical protein BDP27DRAFT_1333564 [Rhodocollybia butyracea]
MGGSLLLYKLDYDGDDAFEELGDGDSFSYRYQGWHTIKAEVLRAGITYLDSSLRLNFFTDNDITLPSSIETDEEALSEGRAVINAALTILRSWVREPQNNGQSLLFPVSGLGGGPASSFAMSVRMHQMMESKDLDGLMDMSYHSQKIMDIVHSPVELAKVGMRGMFAFMRLGDNAAIIYPEEAQLMVPVLEKVFPLIEDTENFDTLQECVGQLRDLFAKCQDGYYITG